MEQKFVYNLIKKQAELFPMRVAIKVGAHQISYADLLNQVQAVEDRISLLSLPYASVIGVHSSDVTNQVVSMLATFNSGHIFMPLENSFSTGRWKHIFEVTAPKCIIVSRQQQDEIKPIIEKYGREGDAIMLIIMENEITLETLHAGRWEPWSGVLQQQTMPVTLDADAGCYLYFTSGSTGTPKAILGKHNSVSHFIQWEIKEFGIGPNDIFSQLIPFTFDAYLRDVLVPLCAGATLSVPTTAQREKSHLLLEYLAQEKITTIHSVPSFFRMVMNAMRSTANFQTDLRVQRILLSGEPLFSKDINQWRELTGNQAEFVNLYGPSETTMVKTFNRINTIPNESSAPLPVGKPIDDTVIAILDPQLKLCSIGEVGEVFIKTPYMTKGYYKDPDRTREVFIQNPFVTDRDELIYKTGDLGRYLPDRSVELLGRVDQQVKINGVRLELGEVEHQMRQLEGIAQVVVMSRTTKSGIPTLCCYYSGQEQDDQTLQTKLRENLQAVAIPNHFIFLKEFPLTLSGKVDRKALPIPEAIVSTQYVPPANEVEQALEKIWCEILGISRASRDASFFELGGNSLLTIQLNGRILRDLNADIKLSAILKSPTLAAQADLVAKSSKIKFLKIPKAPIANDYPLSHAQKRLWVLSQFKENRVAYNIVKAYQLEGTLNLDHFRSAVSSLMQNNEILRTNFVLRNGEPRQIIAKTSADVLQITNVQEKPQSLTNLMDENSNHQFDLSSSPLLRITLFRTHKEKFVLQIVIHHIITDAWSIELLLQELTTLYNGLLHGQAIKSGKTIQYKDFTHWQLKQIETGEFATHRDYWIKQFANAAPIFGIPTDKPRPQVKTFNGGELVKELEPRFINQINSHCAALGTSTFMYLLGVVQILFYKYTGQEDIVLGTTVSGRNHPDLEDQLGFYVNTIPIRISIQSEKSFTDFLGQLKEILVEAYDHQFYPFDQLVQELNIDRDPSRSPLFDVTVDLINLNVNKGEVELNGVRANEKPSGFTSSKFDLSFRFMGTDQLRLVVEYNRDLYEQSTIESLLRRFEILLEKVCTTPDEQIKKLEVITLAETEELIRLSHGDVHLYPDKTIMELFAKAVSRSPNAPAAFFDSTEFSYEQLDRLSTNLAKNLQSRYGLAPGDRVAILMHHSLWLPVAVLAALKARLVFVPIDPLYPSARMVDILTDAGIHVILVDSENRTEVSVNYVCVTVGSAEDWQDASTDTFLPGPLPHDLAYILYTSGTTGRPKGVMVSHKSLCHYVQWSNDYYFPDRQGSNFGWFTSFSFDLSLTGLFGTLCRGDQLQLFSNTKPANALTAIFYRNAIITCTKLTPSHLILASGLETQPNPNLKALIVGGEALDEKHVAIVRRLAPNATLYNEYGPTEATIGCSVSVVADNTPIDVGRPIPNCSTMILNQDGQLQIKGLSGELYIGGACLSRGYWNRTEETELKFSVQSSGQKMYRTGDRAQWSKSGQLIYLGRIDEQLKIHGHRVEPIEISQLIAQHPDVTAALVRPRLSQKVVLGLVCYFSGTASEDGLRLHAAKHLPPTMIPDHWIRLKEMPLTPNGKVDTARLPDWAYASVPAPVAPRDIKETLLVATFEDVLNKKPIGIHDNFFRIGGDSIKAIQITSKLHRQGFQLEVRDIFQYVTIASISACLTPLTRTISQHPVEGEVKMTPIQHAFFKRKLAKPNHFNQAVMFIVKDRIDAKHLQKLFTVLMNHHDALRMVFLDKESHVQPINLGVGQPVHVTEHDLRRAESPTRELERQAQQMNASLDLKTGPLIKLGLFHLPDNDRLLITIHHLIIDGVSWRILLEDMQHLWPNPEGISLPLKTDSFKSWTLSLMDNLNRGSLDHERTYWQTVKKVANGTNPLKKGLVQPHRTAGPFSSSSRISFSFDKSDTLSLTQEVHAAYHTQINDVLLSGLLSATLTLLSQDTLVLPIMMEGHGRNGAWAGLNLDRTLGWFTSQYPIVLTTREPDLGSLIISVKETLRQVPGNGLGYGVLAEFAEQPNEFSVSCSVAFNYLGQFDSWAESSILSIAPESIGSLQATEDKRWFDLEFTGFIYQDELTIELVFDPQQYDSEFISSWLNQYKKSLLAIITHCNTQAHAQLTPSDLTYGKLSPAELDKLFLN